jgi:hypothetical protein
LLEDETAGLLSLPPSSPEQEKVSAAASVKAAVSAIFEMSLFIVASPILPSKI